MPDGLSAALWLRFGVITGAQLRRALISLVSASRQPADAGSLWKRRARASVDGVQIALRDEEPAGNLSF